MSKAPTRGRRPTTSKTDIPPSIHRSPPRHRNRGNVLLRASFTLRLQPPPPGQDTVVSPGMLSGRTAASEPVNQFAPFRVGLTTRCDNARQPTMQAPNMPNTSTVHRQAGGNALVCCPSGSLCARTLSHHDTRMHRSFRLLADRALYAVRTAQPTRSAILRPGGSQHRVVLVHGAIGHSRYSRTDTQSTREEWQVACSILLRGGPLHPLGASHASGGADAPCSCAPAPRASARFPPCVPRCAPVLPLCVRLCPPRVYFWHCRSHWLALFSAGPTGSTPSTPWMPASCPEHGFEKLSIDKRGTAV